MSHHICHFDTTLFQGDTSSCKQIHQRDCVMLTFDGGIILQNFSRMNQFQVGCRKFGIGRFLLIKDE